MTRANAAIAFCPALLDGTKHIQTSRASRCVLNSFYPLVDLAIPMSTSPVKIGFIGYGRAARIFHLPFVKANPNFVIHAFFQRSPAPSNAEDGKGVHCTSDYPEAKHYSDLDKFLADPEIELVSIVTKHDTHSAFAEKALLAGKHGMWI